MPSHELSDDTTETPPLKRTKIDDGDAPPHSSATLSAVSSSATVAANILPPSHSLLGIAPPLQGDDGAIVRLMESDVGISEYIAKDVPKIGGIIKQPTHLPKRLMQPIETVLSTLPLESRGQTHSRHDSPHSCQQHK